MSRWGVYAAVGALLAIVCALIAPQASLACSCAYRDPGDLLRQGEPALIGKVIDAQEVDAEGAVPFDPTYRYTVRVERAFNADLGSEVTIEANSSSAACGIRWKVGERVAAFIYRDGEHWGTTLCGGADPKTLAAAGDRLDFGLRARLGKAVVDAGPRTSPALERLVVKPGARIRLRLDERATMVKVALARANGRRSGPMRAVPALGKGKLRWRATLPRELPRRADRLLVSIDRGGKRETLAVGLTPVTAASGRGTAAHARAGRGCPGRAWAAAPSALI